MWRLGAPIESVDPNEVSALDRSGYVVLEALTRGLGQSAATFARPHAFICIDGRTYWVKANAQQGLVAELIAGRLAAKVGAGPMARIIRVTQEALQEGEQTEHLVGVMVGSEDQPGTVNARDLQPFIADGRFQPGLIDPVSRARVIAFQTWIGTGDAQVLVRLTDGAVFSIDHGDCFGSTIQDDPSLTVTPIPGVSDLVGKSLDHVQPALQRIEAITDQDLLDAVARLPGGEPWRSRTERRADIAGRLAYRRDRLRQVMETWLQT